MRLSEAIRLGATMKPQCFGQSFVTDAQGGFIATCAIGAAWEAWGVKGYWTNDQLTMLDAPASCPEDCGWHVHRSRLHDVIPHLNDDHHWTRERIADFVELHEGLPAIEATESQEVAL